MVKTYKDMSLGQLTYAYQFFATDRGTQTADEEAARYSRVQAIAEEFQRRGLALPSVQLTDGEDE